MGFIPEKKKQFESMWSTAEELADHVKDVTDGDGFIFIDYVEGSDNDPSALIVIDVPSYSTFSMNGKDILEKIIHESDGVNFFVTEHGWIRITLIVRNEWEIEKDPYKTDVVDIRFKREGE